MTPDLEPSGTNAFAAAVQWLEATLLGTVATAAAVIAVASLGFLLMTGRIDVRRGAQVLLGCFILFGASTIASGIVGSLAGADAAPVVETPPSPLPLSSDPTLIGAKAQPAVPYDPYAGAAMPVRN